MNEEKNDVVSIKTDPLPSWNEGQTKSSILTFVEEVTTVGNPNFVPVSERIATFDNDGNLWSEQPLYFQLYFAIDRVKAMAKEHPEWDTIQPFQAVLEDDMTALLQQGEHGLLTLVMATHANLSTSEFETITTQWITKAKHPTKNRLFTDLVYQPMLELIRLLQDKEFKVFIVSGGGIEFMRPWAENIYGIPKDQVVGSSIKTVYEPNNGEPLIRRLAEIDFIDDKAGKPIGIHKFIGRKPLFASGNSDGDLQMLQWSASNALPNFQLFLHHTDSIREWKYDRKSHIGRLDKGLDEASARSWTVIDMQNDWNIIYPYELKP